MVAGDGMFPFQNQINGPLASIGRIIATHRLTLCFDEIDDGDNVLSGVAIGVSFGI